MSINLCDEKLGTKVKCSQISCDGYEVINLISSDLEKRDKGFRAEYYIKPPVNLVFEFPIPIDVRAIIFDLKSGHHEASGLIVSTLTKTNGNSEHEMKVNHIGRYDDLSQSKIVLINSSYRVNDCMKARGFHLDPCKPDEKAEKFYIAKSNQQYCRDIIGIEIKLTRTKKSSIVCLKGITIIGQPTIKSFKDDRFKSKVNEILSESCGQQNKKVKNQPPSLYGASDHDYKDSRDQSKNQPMEDAKRKSEEEIVPSDFLDSLTNELMEFPFTLPSGQTIDKTTLDRYLENEAKWGREPSDPFTTQPFTRDRQPIPNTPLKARIDRYCLRKMFKSVPDWYTQ